MIAIPAALLGRELALQNDYLIWSAARSTPISLAYRTSAMRNVAIRAEVALSMGRSLSPTPCAIHHSIVEPVFVSSGTRQ